MSLARALRLAPSIREYVWAPLLVLLVGLGATAALTWQIWRMAEAKDADRFRDQVRQTRQNLDEQLEAYSAALRDLAAQFSATGGLAPEEFRAQAHHLERVRPEGAAEADAQQPAVRYLALLGVAWIRRDPEDARQSGPAASRLRFADDPGHVYAIAYVEPPEWRDRVSPNFGAFRAPATRAAFVEARDSGRVAASGRIGMAQDFWSLSRNGMHLVQAVYRGGRAPAAAVEKRRRLLGLVDLMLDTDELLAQSHAGQRDLAFEVYEGGQSRPEAVLYRSDAAFTGAGPRHEPRFTDSVFANVGGRTWTLVFRSTPEFEAASDRGLIPTVGLVGLLITLLLASANLFQSRARSALNASELRYRRLFEASPDGVFLFDAQSGLLTDANPYMAELLGLAREKLVGKALWEIGLFPDAAIGHDAHRHLMERDYRRYEQLPVVAPDGRRWHVDVTCNAYRTEGRRVIQCNVRNITDRKQAQDALLDSEERYRTLVEVSPQGVWTANREGMLTYANQFWIEYSGMSSRDASGTGWNEQVHPDDRERMREAWLRALLAGSVFSAEIRLRRAADGEYRWHLARAIPLRAADGRIDRWLGVFVDIHERKQSEEERDRLFAREQAMRGQAEAANRAKDDFLATLSHELRTPLNAILGWTQTLRRGEASKDSLLRALAQIETSAQAQARLVNDLLNVADIGAGRLRLEIRPVHLGSLVESVAQSLLPAMEARRIRFETAVDPDAGEIAGDPARLQQIAWNLLSNAVKFTPHGGVIRLELRRRPSHVEIAVIDSGEGIDPAFLPFVFDRFRQADESIKRRHGGLGLGLAIVRHLAELHGGSVTAHSDGEGRGACFAVQLPLRAAPAPAEPAIGPKPAAKPTPGSEAAAAPATPARPLQGLRILSVDDDPGTREMLHEALHRSGAEVASAESARQALDRMKTFRPHVVVSDIGLPDEDGYDLIRKIRALPSQALSSTPAVALTGYARPQDQQAVHAAGFEAFASKPVDLGDLVATILRISRQSRQLPATQHQRD